MAYIRHPHQFSQIQIRLVLAGRADALPDDRQRRDPDARSGDRLDAGNAVCDGICSDRGGSKQRDLCRDHDFAELEDQVFKACRQADREDFFDVLFLRPQCICADRKRILRAAQPDDQPGGRGGPGDQRRKSGSEHTHMQSIDEQRVQRDIQDIHAE